MSTDALFQLGIVPVSLNTTQTEELSLALATGRASSCVPVMHALGALAQMHCAARSSFPPTPFV